MADTGIPDAIDKISVQGCTVTAAMFPYIDKDIVDKLFGTHRIGNRAANACSLPRLSPSIISFPTVFMSGQNLHGIRWIKIHRQNESANDPIYF